MRNRSLALLMVLQLVAAAGLTGGCSSYEQRRRAESRYAPAPRPVAMQRPEVRFSPLDAAEDPGSARAPRIETGGVPWYAYRNDVRRSVAAGAQSPTATRSYVRSFDRISIHDGRAHNSFRRYRVTERVTESLQ
jgi:hypothetical protein